MPRVLGLFGRPAFHVLLGLGFLVLFTWPFLGFSRPIHTWIYLHVIWAIAVVVLLLTGRAGEPDPEDEEPESNPT